MPPSRRKILWRLSDALGGRISRVGERMGCEWLVYNPLTFLKFDRQAAENADAFTQALLAAFPGTCRTVDVGCGGGAYAAALQAQGVNCAACEHSPVGRFLARRRRVAPVKFDLARTPPARLQGHFDVAYSIEVAEHLSPALGDALVKFLCELADQILFTAAGPGQLGEGHVNCQPKGYWIARFAQHGFVEDAARTACVVDAFRSAGAVYWLTNNAMTFTRIPMHDRR